MGRTAGSNYPGGREPIDKVRRLQRKLYGAAKQQKGRRFHALYDRFCRSDVLREVRDELRAGKYRPPPVLRRYIPKPDGRQRPLGIPTVKDRVVQAAAKLVLEPIFEADFLHVRFERRRVVQGAQR